MKKLITSLFTVATFFLYAQKTITGKVSDTSGNAIPSASVTVENSQNSVIIAYGITDAKGNFKIPFTTDLANVRVKVKAFNQKSQVKEIKNEDQTLNFKLDSDVTEIKEVVLKTKLITKKGDTISYDITAFANKNDRVLSDALKKMPGVEVASDGSITYQGTAINKFYINGKDLMEGGYGTINNSLPLDAIGKVEIMENHQPVKILQDKVPSEQAAFNIKLKKKVTMTGRGEVGMGGSPLLWNVKLTPMLFTDKIQWVFNYKTNNNGESVENEGNIMAFGSRFEGIRRNASQTSWLNVENAATPSVPQKRYLMNNVHYLSGNLLTNLNKSKEWEFKANANYTNNAISRESFVETHYIPPFNNGAVISNAVRNNFYTDKIKGEMIFTKNAKKGFFKNTTSFTQFWNADRADVSRTINGVNDADNTAGQGIEAPTTNFQNSLSTIIPWKEKLINLRSFINYQNDKQTLRVNPFSYTPQEVYNKDTQTMDPIFQHPLLTKYANQYLRMKTFETQEAVNMSFSAKRWTFTPEVGFNYTINKLNSALTGEDNHSVTDPLDGKYQNDLKFSNVTPYVSGQINYKGTNFNMYLTLPVNFNNIKAEDPAAGRNVDIRLNKTTFEPSTFMQYEFASFWKASANGSISNNFGTIGSVYAGYILMSPVNLSRPYSNGILAQNKSQSGGVGIEYRNPLNNLFFNVRSRVSKTTNNLMLNTFLDNGNTTSEYIVRDNDINSNSQSVEVGKYFPSFKTNASIGFSNSNNKSLSMNNSIIQRTKSNNQSFNFKVNNAFFSWMSLDYNFSLGFGESTFTYLNTESTVKNNNLSHNLNLIFYPIENHSIGLNWDQNNFKQGNQLYKNPFYDLTYQYTWAKKRIDFEVKWLNIANTKVYETINTGSTGTTYRRMYIRPSQVMFTVKFNFK